MGLFYIAAVGNRCLVVCLDKMYVLEIQTVDERLKYKVLIVLQVRAVRALVYVLKRLPAHANKEQEEASQVLTQVLRVVNNVDESNNEPRRQSFQGVVDVLAAELFNPNATHIVRKNVQSCLALLASRTGSEVSELLENLYEPLLHPLVVKPLRSKHAEQQVRSIFTFFLVWCLLEGDKVNIRLWLSNLVK